MHNNLPRRVGWFAHTKTISSPAPGGLPPEGERPDRVGEWVSTSGGRAPPWPGKTVELFGPPTRLPGEVPSTAKEAG
ncbi:hypothetical protein GCM10010452_37840 [Crossiella cryophila]